MKIKLVAYGIAKDILQQSQLHFAIDGGSKIEDLKRSLMEQYPDFEKLRSLKFAVNEDYQEDNYELSPTDEVVIIPPVSGG
ncbi:MAG: MoaD/ThiS family protein [Bacteroidota bacterium]